MFPTRASLPIRAFAAIAFTVTLAALAATSNDDLPKCPADAEVPASACGERVVGKRVGWLGKLSTGSLGIPLSYTKSLLSQATTANQTWMEILCGRGRTHCPGISDWPGPSTHMVGTHDAVVALGKQLPAKTWHAAWWRGSELALWIISPAVHFHTDASAAPLIDPPAIGLGALPRQHAVMRPMVKQFFDMDLWDDTKRATVTDLLRTSARDLMEKCRNQERLSATDISVWFQQSLHKIIFDVNISDQYAADFASIGQGYVPVSLMGYSLPKIALDRDPFNVKSRQRRAAPYISSLREWLRTKHAHLFDSGDCAPSRSCVDQGAYGTFDALQFAGGLSIPSSLMTAVALLYSASPMNPARKSRSEGFTYEQGKELQFFWESMRFFPPVDSVPFWDVRPLCNGLDRHATDALNKPHGQADACPLGPADNRTGFPDMNVYAGGRRWLLSLALSLRDPTVWGTDASEFRLRPLDVYEKYSTAFAEMAEDPNVADGGADRSCPGRKLALLFASSFLSVFQKEHWSTSPNSPIVLQQAVPYVKPYALFPKRVIQECMEKACKCSGDMGFVRRKWCSICTSRKCPK